VICRDGVIWRNLALGAFRVPCGLPYLGVLPGPRKTTNKPPCVNIGKMGFLLRAKTGFFEFRSLLHKDLFQRKMNKNSINNKFF
jgi:hypothetical protein